MNNYNAPQLNELGSIQSLTGIFGTESRADIFVGPAGEVVQEGTGSIDACATIFQDPSNSGRCLAAP